MTLEYTIVNDGSSYSIQDSYSTKIVVIKSRYEDETGEIGTEEYPAQGLDFDGLTKAIAGIFDWFTQYLTELDIPPYTFGERFGVFFTFEGDARVRRKLEKIQPLIDSYNKAMNALGSARLKISDYQRRMKEIKGLAY